MHSIRRAAFDLTGLPPSPEEVETFVKDPDPNAYEKLVDRLLASRNDMASDGAVCGWTSRAMPIPAAMRRMFCSRMPGAIAIT